MHSSYIWCDISFGLKLGRRLFYYGRGCVTGLGQGLCNYIYYFIKVSVRTNSMVFDRGSARAISFI